MTRCLTCFFARCFALAATTCVLLSVGSAHAQSRLLEPDFSGMFIAGNAYPQLMLRDSARGWNYVGGAGSKVDGVTVSTFLFRLSDAGLPDTQWTLPADFQVTELRISADGTPFAQAYLKDSPTYEKRWYRLNKDSIGAIKPVELGSVTELPPSDCMRIATDASPLRAADGTQTIIDVVQSSPPTYTLVYTLRKRNSQGILLWEHPIGGTPQALAIDAQGRSYVLGAAITIAGKSGNLLRVLADGRVDTDWSPAINIASNVESRARVVGEHIVVVDIIRSSPPVNRIGAYSLASGDKQMERFPSEIAYTGDIADDGAVLSLRADGRLQVLNTSRIDVSADRIIDARIGNNGYTNAVAHWRNGYVLGGRFDYWFDGRLYRNLMRLDASFRPDPTWTPVVDGAVSALAVDGNGALVVGGGFAVGSQANLVRFSANGALDSTWTPTVAGKIYQIRPASDGMLLVSGAFASINGYARGSIARFRADGLLDKDWASQPTWPVLSPVIYGQFGRDGIYSMLDAGTGGVLFVWEDGSMNGSEAGVVRLSRDGVGAPLPVPPALAAGPSYARGGGSMMRDPVNGAIYAIGSARELPPTEAPQEGTVLIRLLPPSLTIDTAWTSVAGPLGRPVYGLAYQTDSHVYACRGYIKSELRRFHKITGQEDPDWRSNETYLCDATLINRDGDEATTNNSGGIARFSSTARNLPRTVVEYYARDGKRFFITARAAEQAALNARPDAFVATGMQFAVEDAKVVSTDTTRVPVCRFYAPPETGGSNTHFYGRDSDCALLKRFATLRYEGFDFRAGVAVGGACTAALPYAVYRLFNNAGASNNGNHRYVVSETRRSEMQAAGWVDEDVAFCAASAVDSRSLSEFSR